MRPQLDLCKERHGIIFQPRDGENNLTCLCIEDGTIIHEGRGCDGCKYMREEEVQHQPAHTGTGL